MTKNNLTKEIERLIDPISVGSLHFIQAFNELLPTSIQRKLVESSSKKTPYMGFVVEPYSFFLCYEITDTKKAADLLPDGFKLIKTSIFNDDEPKYYCIFGCIRAHTSAFWGSRAEFYVIAEDTRTGLLSWMIVDYDTDTISYDGKSGLRSPNSKSVMTIDYDGTVFVDIQNSSKNRKLIFDSNITTGQMKGLDQRLWLEGNLSIGYGKELSQKDGDIFSLKFDPREVEKALYVPLSKINLQENSWYPELFDSKPSQLVCFPYAQHFLSDSPGYASNLTNKDELQKSVESIDFSKIKVFSTKSFKWMFMIGSAVSFLITITLSVLLILK